MRNPSLVREAAPAASVLPTSSPTRVRCADDAYRVLLPMIGGRDVECFAALALDVRGRVIGAAVLTQGSASATVVDVRQVFAWSLRQGTQGAAALIVAHNHPSGDPEPSDPDRQITRRLRAAGEILGIPLTDHVILGAESPAGYWSFAENGEMR